MMDSPKIYFDINFLTQPDKIVKCFVDSGNLFGCIISLDLVNKLNLEINETSMKARGVDNSELSVVGVTDEITFSVSECPQICFKEKFFVIKNLAIPINLGYAFLDKIRFN